MNNHNCAKYGCVCPLDGKDVYYNAAQNLHACVDRDCNNSTGFRQSSTNYMIQAEKAAVRVEAMKNELLTGLQERGFQVTESPDGESIIVKVTERTNET